MLADTFQRHTFIQFSPRPQDAAWVNHNAHIITQPLTEHAGLSAPTHHWHNSNPPLINHQQGDQVQSWAPRNINQSIVSNDERQRTVQNSGFGQSVFAQGSSPHPYAPSFPGEYVPSHLGHNVVATSSVGAQDNAPIQPSFIQGSSSQMYNPYDGFQVSSWGAPPPPGVQWRTVYKRI